MKRLISIFLCGFLMFSSVGTWQAIAEDASQLYYLWDIPFGISESEFIEQAYEKTGFNFVPHSGGTGDFFDIETHEEQAISFLGHPLVVAIASFQPNADGNSSYYLISLFFNVRMKTISEVLPLFDSIRLVLQEKYGDPTFAALISEDEKFFTCDAIEGGFDIQRVTDILIADDTIHSVSLAWKNLGIGASKRGNDDSTMMLYAMDFIKAPKPLEVYENRNLPSDAGL